jgi:hypothetical protein
MRISGGRIVATKIGMPTKSTTQRAKRKQRTGKRASTAAGEFVQEEVHKRKRGRGAARSRKQAIAIGLSKARRAGIAVKKKGSAKRKTTRKRTARKAPAKRTRRTGRARGQRSR